jgi:hypothetical protein
LNSIVSEAEDIVLAEFARADVDPLKSLSRIAKKNGGAWPLHSGKHICPKHCDVIGI